MSGISNIVPLRQSLRNSSGINNFGLVARALALTHNPTIGEEETAKWQALQVSVLSAANCFGRVSIGIYLSVCVHKLVQTFLLNRRDCRLRKAQGDEARSAPLYRHRVFHTLSVDRPSDSEHRTFTIRRSLGRDFVWCDPWALPGHRHRMVRNRSVQSIAPDDAAGTNVSFLKSAFGRTCSPRLRELRLSFPRSPCDGQRSLDHIREGVRRAFVTYRARCPLP